MCSLKFWEAANTKNFYAILIRKRINYGNRVDNMGTTSILLNILLCPLISKNQII